MIVVSVLCVVSSMSGQPMYSVQDFYHFVGMHYITPRTVPPTSASIFVAPPCFDGGDCTPMIDAICYSESIAGTKCDCRRRRKVSLVPSKIPFCNLAYICDSIYTPLRVGIWYVAVSKKPVFKSMSPNSQDSNRFY